MIIIKNNSKIKLCFIFYYWKWPAINNAKCDIWKPDNDGTYIE